MRIPHRHPSDCSPTQWFNIQGLGEHRVHGPEKHAFFSTLRRLAGKHARLPNSMIITENIDISASNQPHTSGGFADIKQGKYQGRNVAVKTLRVAMADDFGKIRKVSRMAVFVVGGMSLRLSPSNSAKKLSSGTHYPIRTCWSSSASWVVLNSISLPRCRSGWYTVTLWNTSGRPPQIGWSLCVHSASMYQDYF